MTAFETDQVLLFDGESLDEDWAPGEKRQSKFVFIGRDLDREALNDGPTPLAEVLRRNAYGGRSPQDSEVVARLEAYVRDYVRLLGATARNDLIK